MKIVKVIIDNFKKIKHLEVDLKQRTAFVGENRIGKSTAVEAIYWAITGKQLNGGSDFPSFKPLEDTSRVVSVELVLDDSTTIKKEYYENWVKTKGMSETKLNGHSTNYYINKVKSSTVEQFNSDINKLFGITSYSNTITSTKVDIKQLLCNPLYFSTILDMKERRRVFMELVGEIDSQLILNSDPTLSVLNKDYISNIDGWKTQCKASIREIKKQIELKEYLINELMQKTEPSEDDYNKALKDQEIISEQISSLKNGNSNNSISALQNEISEVEQKIREDNWNKEEEFKTTLRTYIDKENEKTHAIRELDDKIASLKSKMQSTEEDRIRYSKRLDEIKNDMFKVKAELDSLKTAVITADDIVIKCEHCGEIANQTTYEATIAERNNANQVKCEELVFKGKSLRKDYDSTQEQLTNLANDTKLQTEINELEVERKTLDTDLQNLVVERTRLEKKPVDINLELRLNELKTQLVESSTSNDSVDIKEKIKVLEEKLENEVEPIISQKIVFDNALTDINKATSEIEHLSAELSKCETQIIACNTFMLKKYELLNHKAKNVFPDVNFQLIKDNIKEDSWDEVCNPLVSDNVIFDNGSTTEQVMTGIKIIEGIKTRLSLPDMPIFFDFGEAFTNNTAKTIKTNSQIVVAVPKNNLPLTVEDWGE